MQHRVAISRRRGREACICQGESRERIEIVIRNGATTYDGGCRVEAPRSVEIVAHVLLSGLVAMSAGKEPIEVIKATAVGMVARMRA